MSHPPRHALAAGVLSLAGLLLVLGLAQRPAPLFVNLGAGDEAFARGFRGGWERDGLRQSGETMFHWTEDGSRLELPVSIRSGRVEARLRLARFSNREAEVVLHAGGAEVDRWTQPPRGWRLRAVDLGELRGPVVLRFRSSSPDGEPLGVALDWVELRGAGRVLPSRRVVAGLLALFVAWPIVLGRLGGGRLALVAAVALPVAGSAAVLLDRLGGLVALARSGPSLVILTAALALLARFLIPTPDGIRASAGSPVAAVVVLAATVALQHPFFFYPDVDTHARYLAAVRSDPSVLWDASEFQARTGAWTREVDGQRVAFPYSPVFHLLAWPAAIVLGEVAAVKTTAVVALGASLLLVHRLAGSLGLGAAAAAAAQALFALLPVTTSRLSLALFPALLGQALELMLLAHLVRGFPRLDGARAAAVAALYLAAAQASYTASVINVAATVAVFVLLELATGDRPRALRLAGAYAASAAVVLATFYGRFLPLVWNTLLPSASRSGSADGGPGLVLAAALDRFRIFYDVVPGLLVLGGVPALRAAPRHARRLVLAALLAGLLLLVARYGVPVLFRDAREVELMAAPVCLLAVAALASLCERGRYGRITAVVAAALLAGWGGSAGVAAYAARFLAVDR